jgi:hypothetical protein
MKKEKIKLVSRGEPIVGCGGDPPPPDECSTRARRDPYCGSNALRNTRGWMETRRR